MTRRSSSESFTWLASARCRGADLGLFFPDSRRDVPSANEVEAKKLCSTCPVLTACREWSLRVAPEFGIFGGLTPEERRSLRITRKQRHRVWSTSTQA